MGVPPQVWLDSASDNLGLHENRRHQFGLCGRATFSGSGRIRPPIVAQIRAPWANLVRVLCRGGSQIPECDQEAADLIGKVIKRLQADIGRDAPGCVWSRRREYAAALRTAAETESLRGRVAAAVRLFEEACRTYQEAGAGESLQCMGVRAKLGSCLCRLGRHEEAGKLFNDATCLDDGHHTPEDGEVLRWRGPIPRHTVPIETPMLAPPRGRGLGWVRGSGLLRRPGSRLACLFPPARFGGGPRDLCPGGPPSAARLERAPARRPGTIGARLCHPPFLGAPRPRLLLSCGLRVGAEGWCGYAVLGTWHVSTCTNIRRSQLRRGPYIAFDVRLAHMVSRRRQRSQASTHHALHGYERIPGEAEPESVD